MAVQFYLSFTYSVITGKRMTAVTTTHERAYLKSTERHRGMNKCKGRLVNTLRFADEQAKLSSIQQDFAKNDGPSAHHANQIRCENKHQKDKDHDIGKQEAVL